MPRARAQSDFNRCHFKSDDDDEEEEEEEEEEKEKEWEEGGEEVGRSEERGRYATPLLPRSNTHEDAPGGRGGNFGLPAGCAADVSRARSRSVKTQNYDLTD